MKYFVLLLALTSLLGCSRSNQDGQSDIKDNRSILFYDFKQITQYPELVDDDFENGDFHYMFYKKDDFVTVTICGVDNEDKIKSALEEFTSGMKKREIEQYLVVNVYEKKIRKTDSSATLENLIKTMEIKEF